jgi:pimeloyl-ACP methyl ester carboxylesterase
LRRASEWRCDRRKASRIAFAKSDDPGFPGSRVEALLSHEHARARDLQIIALDRPGIGLSSKQPARPINEVVADQLFALEALGVKEFSIIAVSSGTPHALALRELASSRVLKTAIVSGLWNPADSVATRSMNIANRTFLRMGCRYPTFTVFAVACLAKMWRAFPALAAGWFALWLPKPDRAILQRRDVARVMAANLREALRCGVSGVCQDFLRIASAHPPPSVSPTGSFQIWHGEDDDYVPVSMGQALAHHTDSRLVLIPHAGHFVVVDILDQILDWVAA